MTFIKPSYFEEACNRLQKAEARVAELESGLRDLWAEVQPRAFGPCRAFRTTEALLAGCVTDSVGETITTDDAVIPSPRPSEAPPKVCAYCGADGVTLVSEGFWHCGGQRCRNAYLEGPPWAVPGEPRPNEAPPSVGGVLLDSGAYITAEEIAEIRRKCPDNPRPDFVKAAEDFVEEWMSDEERLIAPLAEELHDAYNAGCRSNRPETAENCMCLLRHGINGNVTGLKRDPFCSMHGDHKKRVLDEKREGK